MGSDVVTDRRAQKIRFGVALVVFVLWVAGLASMAALSGRRPQPKPTPRATTAP